MMSAQCINSVNNVVNTAIAAEELALSGNILADNALAGNAAYGLGYGAPFSGYTANAVAPTSGGGFVVQSLSPIAPTGITVLSENAIEGSVAVNGNLPFLGAIALEGALPTAGAGGINYGCGNGAVGIVSEGISSGSAPSAYSAGQGYGNGLGGGLGYGAGYNGRSGLGLSGCGAVY